MFFPFSVILLQGGKEKKNGDLVQRRKELLFTRKGIFPHIGGKGEKKTLANLLIHILD